MATRPPSVELFGRGRVRTAAGGQEFASDKRWYLLAFLAHAESWVRRDRLAGLFWPDVPTSTSLDRLRQLLRRVRGFAWLTGLEVERSRVRWSVDSDLRAFRDAVERGDRGRALALYRGPLLEGMAPDDAPEFSAWLEVERATLHDRWRTLVLQEAAQSLTEAQRRTILPLLATLLRADAFDEETLRAYMAVLAEDGQRLRALDAYQRFADRLSDELGWEPDAATRRLAASMREGEAAPSSDPQASEAVADRAVAPANTFVGRDVELLEVTSLLTGPGCRMVSLVGLGGVGKSRIAWQVGDGWDGRAHFVRLDGLASATDVPAAIARALGCAPAVNDDPLGRIASHIGDDGVLLMLDDYEHLMAGAGLVSELLRRCPNLAVLVTSRERLGIPEEWVYEVGSMDVPSDDVPLDLARRYDAVRLFLQRVEQVRGDYELTDGDRTHVLRICRLVQGLPLGLELAAAWMRGATAAAIADEVASDLDFLRRRNVADRHRSIRAVFESSWRMLTPEEQRAYAMLAVFRGGFTREAAYAVARAPTPILAALVDKSLLRREDVGRYERHPLLYQYVREKLERFEEADASRRRHAQHFVSVAEDAAQRLRRTRGASDLDALEADHENLREALRWGREHDPVVALRLAGALARFWEIRGYLLEGCDWLEASLSAAVDAPPEVEARALGAYGRLLYLRGEREAAASRIQAALGRWRDAEDAHGVSSALNHLGALAMEAGDVARADALYREALASCRARDDRTGVAHLLNNLGEVARLQGDAPRAEALYEESLALHRELDNQRGVAITLGNLGFVVHRQGRGDEAATRFLESIALKHEIGDRIGLSYCFVGLAGVLGEGGEYARAAHLLGAADALMRTHAVELDAADRAAYAACVAWCRTEMGNGAFARAVDAGRAMEVDAAVAAALTVRPDAGRRTR